MEKEWQQLIDIYGIDEVTRWFVGIKGYEIVRTNTSYEDVVSSLDKLIIKYG